MPRAGQAQPEAVLRFLERHGLQGMRPAYLRRQIERTGNDQLQGQLARTALQVLLEEAAPTSTELEELAAWRDKFPDAESKDLQQAILQALFRQAKQSFQMWLESGRTSPTAQRARRQFEQLVEKLGLPDTAEDPSHSPTGPPQNPLVDYLRAWCDYYLGLLADEPDTAAARFANAERRFRVLLSLGENQRIDTLNRQWIDLSQTWNLKCLIGLALSSYARGQPDTSAACFQLAGSVDSDPEIDRELDQWVFVNFYYPGHLEMALRLVQAKLGTGAAPAFWMTVADAGLYWPEPQPLEARQMVFLSLVELAKAGAWQAIRERVEKHHIQLDHNSFYGHWIQAELDYANRTSRSGESLHRQVIDHCERALELSQSIRDTQTIGKLQWLYARTLYESGLHFEAQSVLEEMSREFRQQHPEIASQALWLKIQILGKVAEDDPLVKLQLRQAVAELKRWFPDSPDIGRAEYQSIRCHLETLDDPVEYLSKMPRHHPSYQLAQYDLAAYLFQHWMRSRTDSENTGKGGPATSESPTSESPTSESPASESQKWYAQLKQQVERIESKFDSQNNPAAHLLVTSYLIEAALGERKTEEAVRWLKRCRPYLQRVHQPDTSQPDTSQPDTSQPDIGLERYHWLSMKVASLSDKTAVAEREADWLVKHASGKTFQIDALLFLLDLYKSDDAGNAAGVESPDVSQLLELHETLYQLLEQDNDLLTSPLLRAAKYALANHQVSAGDYRTAAGHFEELLVGKPAQLPFLLGAARAWQGAGEEATAIEYWRKISQGVAVASEPWLEAKLHIVKYNSQRDRGIARQILNQTLQLAPQMPTAWRTRFDDLARTLTPLSQE